MHDREHRAIQQRRQLTLAAFLSPRAPAMRLHRLDSVVPNGSRTAGFLTGSMAGPLALPPLKRGRERGGVVEGAEG